MADDQLVPAAPSARSDGPAGAAADPTPATENHEKDEVPPHQRGALNTKAMATAVEQTQRVVEGRRVAAEREAVEREKAARDRKARWAA
jgi:hypothetical protein